jgi:hypothetical protein
MSVNNKPNLDKNERERERRRDTEEKRSYFGVLKWQEKRRKE